MTTDQEVLHTLLKQLSDDRNTAVEYMEHYLSQENENGAWDGVIYSSETKADICSVIINDLFTFLNGGKSPEEAVRGALDNTEHLYSRMMGVSRAGTNIIKLHISCRQTLLREHLHRMATLHEAVMA